MNLFDASALLVFLQGEDRADVVEGALDDGGRVSAVNWSEVAQKVRAGHGSWPLASGVLLIYGLSVEPVLAQDADRAALLWAPGGSYWREQGSACAWRTLLRRPSGGSRSCLLCRLNRA